MQPGAPPTPVTVVADSPEEAFRILYEIGRGAGGAGARHFYYGSVLEPIRNRYKLQLERVEAEILRRRAALGANPTAYELRGLAQWAARQRANTARVWRLPTPSLLAGLEARDWDKYGAGGRTFENLLKRNAANGRTGGAAYEYILRSASAPNPEVTAALTKGARYLRGGGAVLGVAGLAMSAYQIYDAPPEQRGAIAERTAVGFAGGLIGSEVTAGLLAVGAGLLAASPPGWIILAVGLVGGIAGAVIADRVFYPPQAEAIADRMSRGYTIDPRRLASYQSRVTGTGATSLPIIRQIGLIVQKSDTPASLAHRAYFLAARSAGLSVAAATAFADRHTTGNPGLKWVSGDPTPKTDATVRAADIASTAGQKIVFNLSDASRSMLTTLQNTQ